MNCILLPSVTFMPLNDAIDMKIVIAINSRDIFVNIITSPDGDVFRTLGKNI